MTGRSAGCAVGEQLRLFPLPPPFWVSLLPAASGLPAGGDVMHGRAGRRARKLSGAADEQRCVEEVGRVLATYVPGSLRGADQAVVAEVMDAARAWVASAGPRDGDAARRLVRALAPMLIWMRQTLGSLDAAMLNDRNVEIWIRDNKHQKGGWLHLARGSLRRVGRAVNPDGWPQPTNIGRSPVAPAYDPETEAVFGLVADLAGTGDRPGRLWVAAGACGAGLNGVELGAAETGDLRELGHSRLAVLVRGHHPRVVPVRAGWTDTVRQAARLAQQRHSRETSARFIGSRSKNATSKLAAGLDFGQGGLSLRRARSTWLTAHLLAGTPLAALKEIAGPLSMQTLDDLLAEVGGAVGPEQAVVEGVRA